MQGSGVKPAIVGPLLIPPPMGDYLHVRYSWRQDFEGAALFIPTSGSLISVAAWRDIGPFREDYFVGGIDVEWGLRAWSRGYVLKVDRDVTLEHRWGLSGEGSAAGKAQILRNSNERNHYYLRNMVDCLKQPHVPFTWKFKYAVRLVGQILLLVHDRGYRPSIIKFVYRSIKDSPGHVNDEQ